MTSDNLIKETLQTSKIIAMVGASVPKENEAVAKMRLKPSIIVMKYLLEFGYKVIPVNPFSVGKKVNGEKIVEKLEDISKIEFSLKKNNEIVQSGCSNDMLWKIDELISYVSQYFTLKIGDLIFTGTPEGVGKVEIGDQLVGFIENTEAFKTRVK